MKHQTWTAFHHRGDVLNAVVTLADERRDGILPLQLPGIADTFDDEIDLLGALHLKWHTRLSGNLERALHEQPEDLELAAARAWARTGRQLPGVRLILDRYTDAPSDSGMGAVMATAQHNEWVALARAAGLATNDGVRAAAAGRRVAARARSASAVIAA